VYIIDFQSTVGFLTPSVLQFNNLQIDVLQIPRRGTTQTSVRQNAHNGIIGMESHCVRHWCFHVSWPMAKSKQGDDEKGREL